MIDYDLIVKIFKHTNLITKYHAWAKRQSCRKSDGWAYFMDIKQMQLFYECAIWEECVYAHSTANRCIWFEDLSSMVPVEKDLMH